MSLKRVEIIEAGPNVGDWVIKVNDVDITDMVTEIVVSIDRAQRKPQAIIYLSPDVAIVPKVLQANTTTAVPSGTVIPSESKKSKKTKEK